MIPASNRRLLPRHPRFVRTHADATPATDGTVHVLDNATTAAFDYDAIGDPALDPYIAASKAAPARRLSEGPDDPVAHLLGIVRTRCGREVVRHRAGFDSSGSLVSAFDDDDLCRACYRTVAPSDQGRLFDHPTLDGTEEA